MTCLVKHPTDSWIITLSLVLCGKTSFCDKRAYESELSKLAPGCFHVCLSISLIFPNTKLHCALPAVTMVMVNWQDHAEVLSSLLFWPRCSSQ